MDERTEFVVKIIVSVLLSLLGSVFLALFYISYLPVYLFVFVFAGLISFFYFLLDVLYTAYMITEGLLFPKKRKRYQGDYTLKQSKEAK